MSRNRKRMRRCTERESFFCCSSMLNNIKKKSMGKAFNLKLSLFFYFYLLFFHSLNYCMHSTYFKAKHKSNQNKMINYLLFTSIAHRLHSFCLTASLHLFRLKESHLKIVISNSFCCAIYRWSIEK